MKLKRHFRKRVVLYSEDRYIVQYAYYNYWPIWRSLNFWFEQTLTGGTECWSLNMWNYDDAVRVAKSLKSIQDVLDYYVPHKQEEADFYKRKSEYLSRNVPVSCEEIE